MPRPEVEGVGTFDVEEDMRLVLAIEEKANVDIMHECGSYEDSPSAASSFWRASRR